MRAYFLKKTKSGIDFLVNGYRKGVFLLLFRLLFSILYVKIVAIMETMLKKKKYSLTLTACYVGYVIQAMVNNLSPLLFVQFKRQFGLTSSELSLVIFINFGLQIIVDSLSAKITEKIGYRAGSIAAQIFSATGLVCLGVLPNVINPFAGIIVATVLMAIGGGFVEVILSPVIEALPLGNKSGAMCFLHSFYCWGHIFTVLIATLYFNVFSIEAWRYLPVVLAAIPLLNCITFAVCPIETLEGDETPSSYKSMFTAKGFWLFPLLILAGGAAEQAIAQWASDFAEIGLGVDKTLGDIFGTCLFALGMALSRTVYGFLGDKIDLKKAFVICGALLTGAYLLAALAPFAGLSLAGIALGGVFVGLLWPGLYAVAGRTYPNGGTKMFGVLALFGDVGCTLGPTLAGLVSSDIKTGILFATIFPVIVLVCSIILRRQSKIKQN